MWCMLDLEEEVGGVEEGEEEGEEMGEGESVRGAMWCLGQGCLHVHN